MHVGRWIKQLLTKVRAEAVRVIGSSHPPKSNLTKGEREALKDLKKDKNITFYLLTRIAVQFF